MYSESSSALGVVPPVAAGVAITVLPATGADVIVTIAATVFTALVAWAGVYIYKLRRQNVN